MMQGHNICTLTDGYKLCHHKQYLPGLEAVYSYFESRPGAEFDETVFFGLQYIIKKYLVGQVVTRDKIEQAAHRSANYFGDDTLFNRAMWEYILKVHNGHLPVRIKAVPEGTPVPVNNVLMTVENLDQQSGLLGPLTNHLETILTHVWYPSTVATLSREVHKIIAPFKAMSVDDDDACATRLMLHDFGFRGATCVEAAGIGGAAHLLNFLGTDTLPALDVLEDYYGSPDAGISVPATEHSVMTAAGPEGEFDQVVDHLLDEHPKGILSIVGDSFDIYNFCRVLASDRYHDRILNRDGVIVVRPDSGVPIDVILDCLKILAQGFGARENDKGYLALPPQIKILWGDGLDRKMIRQILSVVVGIHKWSLSNIATFGMGGGLLQKVHRDTQRFAFKCSAQRRNGVWRDIYKDPIDQSKASKRGKLMLDWSPQDGFATLPLMDCAQDSMNTVFELGHLIWNDNHIETMRKRAAWQE